MKVELIILSACAHGGEVVCLMELVVGEETPFVKIGGGERNNKDSILFFLSGHYSSAAVVGEMRE